MYKPEIVSNINCIRLCIYYNVYYLGKKNPKHTHQEEKIRFIKCEVQSLTGEQHKARSLLHRVKPCGAVLSDVLFPPGCLSVMGMSSLALQPSVLKLKNPSASATHFKSNISPLDVPAEDI